MATHPVWATLERGDVMEGRMVLQHPTISRPSGRGHGGLSPVSDSGGISRLQPQRSSESALLHRLSVGATDLDGVTAAVAKHQIP